MLERIRDIRSSEEVLPEECDIYKLSQITIPGTGDTDFFRIVQNKLHFAISGKTRRSDRRAGRCAKTQHGAHDEEGRESAQGRRDDRKNYLNEEEIGAFNRNVISIWTMPKTRRSGTGRSS